MIILKIIALLSSFLLIGFLWQALITFFTFKKYKPQGKFALVKGKKMHYLLTGQGDITIVLEAGIGGYSTEWQKIASQLEPHFKVLRYDRLGYGWSEEADKARTINQLAEEFLELLQYIGIQSPIIFVGHSLGAYIGRYIAHQNPHKISALLLLDTPHEDELTARFPEEYIKNWKEALSLMKLFANFSIMGLPMLLSKLNIIPQGMRDSLNQLPKEQAESILAIAFTIKILNTTTQEMEALTESFEQMRNVRNSLQDLPLTVIQHSLNDQLSPQISAEKVTEIELAWQSVQQETASLSSQGIWLKADCGHAIHIFQPDLVFTEIQKLAKNIS
jgi:pimeloyl-ACP methyl ester carboxylesterase